MAQACDKTGSSVRQRAALLGVVLCLSACVGGGRASPVAPAGTSASRVILYPDTVTVEMRDKSLCTGPRTAKGASWSGTLAGCRHLWLYEVRQPQGRITRLPLRAGAGGAGQVTLMPPDRSPEVWSSPLGLGG